MRTERPQIRRLILAVIDVAGFARRCTVLADGEIMTALDQYYQAVGAQVLDIGGKVVKCMGDAVFLVFPPESARRTVAKLEVLHQALCGASVNPVLRDCAVHVRVHAGLAACGDVGPVGAKRFDVIGKAVNELFLMRDPGFIVSDAVRELIAEQA